MVENVEKVIQLVGGRRMLSLSDRTLGYQCLPHNCYLIRFKTLDHLWQEIATADTLQDIIPFTENKLLQA